MNKGLLAHIITTMLIIVATIFILQDIQTSIEDRVLIVFIVLVGNIVTSMISYANDWYEEKI